MASLRRLLEIAAEPISGETRARLRATWEALPEHLRHEAPRQFQGRQYVGCGATIGAMPRCDFACRGCYLSAEANRIPPLPVADVKRQLDRLRDWLGEGGNVQLTDGELTLLPRETLVAIVQHARRIGLAPMLMSHGEALRRDPDLLETLMVEGGLREVALHVDVTQRGPRTRGPRDPRCERDLDGVRDALADRIRRARAATGRPLEAAMTVTVTDRSLSGVAGTVRWAMAHADAFKMVSFQPLARVGRTDGGLGGVGPDALWREIARGLWWRARSPAALDAQMGWLGHPECSRFVQGWVVQDGARPPRFASLIDATDPGERELVEALLARFAGLPFRRDDRSEALVRAASLALRHPGFLLGRLAPAAWRRLARLAEGRPGRLLARAAAGRARVHYLNVVSHHFMSADEIRRPRGRERLSACAFRVPLDGRLVSMCEANALGLRARFYDALAARAARPALRSSP